MYWRWRGKDRKPDRFTEEKMDIAAKDTVDRDAQSELFTELLKFKSVARLLRVQDKPGSGKSQLLKKLEYHCTYDLEKPVSYVPLENFRSQTDFDLIRKIRRDLQSLEFREFDGLLAAYEIQDAVTFKEIGRVSGRVDAGGATISGGTQAGVVGTVNQPNNQYIGTYNAGTGWSPGLEKFAEERCIEKFLVELKQVCASQEVVLLLDSWDKERTSPERRDWLVSALIKPYCLDPAKRPAKLIAIVAGRDVDDFKTLWGGKYSDSVRESPFEVWNKDHVRDFLKVHGFKDLTPNDIDYVCGLMNGGCSLQEAIDVTLAIQQIRRPKAS